MSWQPIAHMTTVARSFGKAIIIRSDRGVLRSLEVQTEPPVDHEPDRDICDSEGVSDDVGSRPRQMLIKLPDLFRNLSAPLLDEPRIIPWRFIQHAAEKSAAQ